MTMVPAATLATKTVVDVIFWLLGLPADVPPHVSVSPQVHVTMPVVVELSQTLVTSGLSQSAVQASPSLSHVSTPASTQDGLPDDVHHSVTSDPPSLVEHSHDCPTFCPPET